jgi:hypothetical protein
VLIALNAWLYRSHGVDLDDQQADSKIPSNEHRLEETAQRSTLWLASTFSK